MNILNRQLTATIEHSLKTDRVTAIMGPRQAGKTTLVTRLLSPERPTQYYNLKDPDIRQHLTSSARKEFAHYRDHLIVLDEVQKVPALLELIQLQVDKFPDSKGQFLLLGSNHLLLNRQLKESLAGRVSIFTLLPFSFAELNETGTENLLLSLLSCTNNKNITDKLENFYLPVKQAVSMADKFMDINMFGSYPEFISRKDPDDRKIWLKNYHQTYLDTDLRELVDLRNPESFERFEKIFSTRIAALLNISEVARDCGLSTDTVRRFLGYYRQLFVAWPCLPYHANLNKRMMKMPKWYFYDTGLLRSVAGDFREGEGVYYENTVLAELQKTISLHNPFADLSFARTATGIEVDAIFTNRHGNITFFIEIKLSEKIHNKDIRHIKKFAAESPNNIGIIINNSPFIENVTANIWSVPACWLFA